MVQLHCIDPVPHKLFLIPIVLNDLEDLLIYMHRREVLSYVLVVGVRKAVLQVVQLKKVVYVHSVHSFPGTDLLAGEVSRVGEFFTGQHGVAGYVGVASVRGGLGDLHPRVGQELGNRDSLCWNYSQQPFDQILALSCKQPLYVRREVEVAGIDDFMQILHVLCLERDGSTKHGIEEDSETPEIGIEAVVPLVSYDLRSDIGWGSALFCDILVQFHHPADSEIADFNHSVLV
jgi:hypothetical protein